ncbi:MAG TPA: hypothetical protein VHK24_14925 [Steroidobacter sp.]|jgi:cytoskeletal protein RodZ|nr:hypothetical protein [Steroidobacter sp.]
MSQHSEDRLDESTPPSPEQSARILPFERPQSDLQRAIQLRAQEAIDLERERDREAKRPAPLRWLIVLAIAALPVVLIFGAVDGFLRAFYKVNETYNAAPAAPQSAQPEPSDLQSSTPGVVILESYENTAQSAPRSAPESELTHAKPDAEKDGAAASEH